MYTIPVTDAHFRHDMIVVWKKREDVRRERCAICGKTEEEGGCDDMPHIAHAIAAAEQISTGQAQSVPFSASDMLAEIVADLENSSAGKLLGEILVALGENALVRHDYATGDVACVFCHVGISAEQWEDNETIVHESWCLTNDAIRAIHAVLDIEEYALAEIPLPVLVRVSATSLLRFIVNAVDSDALVFHDKTHRCFACVCCDANIDVNDEYEPHTMRTVPVLTADSSMRSMVQLEHQQWCLAADAGRVIRKLSV